jgi:hypothetical protein
MKNLKDKAARDKIVSEMVSKGRERIAEIGDEAVKAKLTEIRDRIVNLAFDASDAAENDGSLPSAMKGWNQAIEATLRVIDSELLPKEPKP